MNLASSGSLSGSHTFSVARGQGSTDLNILANIADGSTHSQSLLKTGNGILQLSGTNLSQAARKSRPGPWSWAATRLYRSGPV